ncbi:MAG: pyrroline-5-carboxylate reductase [Pseudomonadales bacterium]
MQTTKIAFIGAGNMASALIGGMLGEGFTVANIRATDPYQPSLDSLRAQFGVSEAANNVAAADWADVVVLAVKPQVMKDVITELRAAKLNALPLFISIAAGITSASIQAWLGQPASIVRCMPNTPALMQLGASGLCASALVSAEQRELTDAILSAVGITCWVENEGQLDAVTAVSGSGPAYFFAVMEAMQNVAISMGLDEAVAAKFVQQTALGAARMAQDSDVDVAELRRRVSSPGGTTLAALQQLEAGGLDDLFAVALEAARARAEEMGRELGDI